MSGTIYGGVTKNGVIIQDMVDDSRDYVYRDERFQKFFARFAQSLLSEDDTEFETAGPAIAIFSDEEPFEPIWGQRLEGPMSDYTDGWSMTELFMKKVAETFTDFGKNRKPLKMTDVEIMIRSGALNVKWDNWFFAGGRDWGDQDTYFLLRDGKEVGILQDNHDHGITIELDSVRICDELNEDDLVQYMEETLAMALRRDDKELMKALRIDDYTSFYLPRDYCDISREDVIKGRWNSDLYMRLDERQDILDRCYEAYKLDWMISHGYSIKDYLNALVLEDEEARASDNYPEGGTRDIYESLNDAFEFERGFDGCIWACKDEFLSHEFQDKDYMKHLTSTMPNMSFDYYLEALEA